MILGSSTSRQSIVNLVADFILKKIPQKETSIIEVADCINFLVIKGKTTHKEVLNLADIFIELKQNHSLSTDIEKLFSRTIDVIEYDVELTKKDNLVFSYYNTENCQFNHSQIEKYTTDNTKTYMNDHDANEVMDTLIVSSYFPFGYSLDMGRELYYFGKHITYNIPSNYPFTKITLSLNNDSEKLKVFDDFSKEYDEGLRSAILDCINWDMSWISTEIEKVDWCIETTNPLLEYDFLKKKVKDFIII